MTKEQAAERAYPNPDDERRVVELQSAFITGWDACEANRWIPVDTYWPEKEGNYLFWNGYLIIGRYVLPGSQVNKDEILELGVTHFQQRQEPTVHD